MLFNSVVCLYFYNLDLVFIIVCYCSYGVVGLDGALCGIWLVLTCLFVVLLVGFVVCGICVWLDCAVD